jgi:hypothetical protein
MIAYARVPKVEKAALAAVTGGAVECARGMRLPKMAVSQQPVESSNSAWRVQFKALRPSRRDSIYWLDNRLLLEAEIALYLKESLGTSTEVRGPV